MIIAIRSSSRERLAYVHGILLELRTIADAERFGLLTHFVEMAYIESGDMLRASRPSQPPGKARHWKVAAKPTMPL
jgi:hypothetical protein